jgi:RNA polymerase sigma-70 factor (ECF subfamily)
LQVKSRVIEFQRRTAAADRSDRQGGIAPSQLQSLSDEALMEYLKDGYHDALALIFERYYRLVVSVAFEILHDRGEAEDLMQDVFFEIYRAIENFDPLKGSVKTWILQYAYHRSLNRRQYLNLRHFYDRQQICELEALEPRCASDTWNGLTYEEWARVIQQGLATLNDKQRTTLELACFHGLLLSEIADRINESQANVRHYYYRGLKKLRDSLRERSCFEGKLVRSREEDEL